MTEIEKKRSKQQPFVSMIVPALNEADNLVVLYERLDRVMTDAGCEYELIVVDDGSSDNTLELLKELRGQDERVHYVSFSRNFGHQAALVAGLEWAQGDIVVSLDADLQHPPELIIQLMDLWAQGYDVVYTIKRQTSVSSTWRRMAMRLGYALIRRLGNMNISFGQSDFRLLDRKVVNEIIRLPERDKFLRGLVDWVGFSQAAIHYDVAPRNAGKAKYNLRSLLGLLGSGLLNFTIFPIRFFSIVGIFVSSVAFLYGFGAGLLGLYAIYTGRQTDIPYGWGSIMAAVTFLGGVQLIGIGLLGEYIGRIYDQTKNRPLYIAQEASRSQSDSLQSDI